MDHSNSHISRLEVCCTDMKKLVQPVKKFAQESGLKVHAFPPNIQTGEFDLGVVASFGHLIPTNLINKFPRYGLYSTFVFDVFNADLDF